MIRNPFVTVLMTVYNGGEYLRAAVRSVLAQSYPDFEFLIIDDQSTDRSSEIVRGFSDQRIRLVQNEINLGQTRSLNKGLALARGQVIARMDADDIAFPQWIAKVVAQLESETSCAVASCRAVVIDERGQVQKALNTPTSYEDMVLRSLFASPINHVGSVFKTDVIRAAGGYDETLKIAADYELWSQLIRQGIRLCCVPEVLVAIRMHSRSLSIRESGGTDFNECVAVMDKNIKSLSGVELSREEIAGLWKMNYAPQKIELEEFQGKLSLFRDICGRLGVRGAVSKGAVEAFLHKQTRVFFAKQIFTAVQSGDNVRLRQWIRAHGSLYGWPRSYLFLWVLSWLGVFWGKITLFLYKNLLFLKARNFLAPSHQRTLVGLRK